MGDATGQLEVRDLGRMPYDRAFKLQRQVHTLVLTGQIAAPGALLLVEHDPVITISARRGAGANVLADRRQLQKLGIALRETNRGGDVTYHGPGQLVAYPILRLSDLRLSVGRYMRLLEQVVIDTLAAWQIAGRLVAGATGVWVEAERARGRGPGAKGGNSRIGSSRDDAGPRTPDHGLAKIAAFGVRVRKNVSLHGLALNVTTDLDHFQTIIPCGLDNRNVTSLRHLLGDACPGMDEVKQELVKAIDSAIAQRMAR